MMSERFAPAVIAKNLVLSYGDHVALASSDFEIPAGRMTALIGANGSGKSTILNALAGLLRPASGTLEVPVSRGRADTMAYVLQATRVNEAMPVTVGEVVAMGRYAHLGPFRAFGERDRAACRLAMERLGLISLASRHLDELSGGQRQRVFVAQGLAQDATLLLLDEPVTALDLPTKDRILAVMREERARGTTIVFTTHDLDEAAAADHVLLLAGRVVAAGPPSEVLTAKRLYEAYGVRFVGEGARVMIDDAHHRPAATAL
jgi:iron complex transport system ATP-binding protein